MRLLISILLLVTTSWIFAQEFNAAKMDSFVNILEKSNKGMFSFSVYHKDAEIYHRSVGYADLENNVTATRETKYRIGSISKTFTASLIMKLVEEGKLDLNSTLSQYYPDFENSEKITIEHLLRHRSGIFNFTGALDFRSWYQEPISKSDLVNKIIDYGTIFNPGEKKQYSNSNYVLLSFIAEKVTGESFENLIQKEICKPCFLKNTYYGGRINPVNKEAYSYNKKSKEWKLAIETDMSIPVGAGAVVSTPSDLNKFLICLYGNKFLSVKSVENMKELVDGYGLGMFAYKFDNKVAYGHNGRIDDFISIAYYFPEEQMSISITMNGASIRIDDLLLGILNIYFDNGDDKKRVEVDKEILKQYVGLYTSPSFSLDIKITRILNNLYAQATGQRKLSLEAKADNIFVYDSADLELIFNISENSMVLKQKGRKFVLKKE